MGNFNLRKYLAEGKLLKEEESIQLSPKQKEDFKDAMISLSNSEDTEYAVGEAGNVLAHILTDGEAEFIEDVEDFGYDPNKVEEFAQNLSIEILYK
jgi:hypothetical protein